MPRDDTPDRDEPITLMYQMPTRSERFTVSGALNFGSVARSLFSVSEEEIQRALEVQKTNGKKIGEILVARGILTNKQVTACLEVLGKREGTFLSHAFLAPLYTSMWGRRLQLWLESLGALGVTLLLVHGALGIRESGVIALFLASAVLTTRFERLLMRGSWRAQAVDVLMMFLGLFTGFVVLTMISDGADLQEAFGFVIQLAQLGDGATIYSRNFGGIQGLLRHNGTVLTTVIVLAFVYRAYGAVLILGWNAAVWGLVLTTLVIQSADQMSGSMLAHGVLSALAVLPHLTLEAVSYVIGAIAAIGLSKGILWTEAGKTRLSQVLHEAAITLGMAVTFMLLGALTEAYFAPMALETAGALLRE
jgi:hypothetical protein